MIVAVAALLLSPLAAAAVAPHAAAEASSSAVAVSPPTPSTNSPGAHLATEAAASLAAGEGPAAGHSWSCSASGPLGFTCKGPQPLARAPGGASSDGAAAGSAGVSSPRAAPGSSSAVQPAVAGGGDWFNQTFSMSLYGSISPPVVYYAAAAYDPSYSSIVLFGGCSYVCPTNATWFYSGFGWENLTDSIYGYVPAMFGMSLVWDPAADSLLMVGGFNVFGVGLNTTWELSEYTWWNITGIVGYVGDYEPGIGIGEGFATVAYDDQLNEVLLLDGCIFSNCSDAWNQFWVLGAFGWQYEGLAPWDATFDSAWRWGAQVAYDPVDQEVVVFGGWSYYGGLQNSTWIYNSTGWYNLTATSYSGILCGILPGFCYYPAGRDFGVMSWDGQLGEMIMTGGWDGTGYANDTWYFVGNHWYPSGGIFGGFIPGPIQAFGAAMPENSTDVAPVMVGGFCLVGFCENQSWVFEAPGEMVFYHVTPSPSDIGYTVNVSAGIVPGTASGPIYYLYLEDNAFPENDFSAENYSAEGFLANISIERNFSYTTPGVYTISLFDYDFYWVETLGQVTLQVNDTLAAAAFADPGPSTEVGFETTLHAGTSGGTSPNTYSWNFGDGSPVSTAAQPTHTFATAGHFTVTLEVTDALGETAESSFVETVEPALTATITGSTATDLGKGLTLTGNGVNGVGPYASYAWTFGDSDTGTGQTQAHTYAAIGTYTVELVVTDALGVTADATEMVTINTVPTGTISSSTATPTTATNVQFTASPSGGTAQFTYAWTFGDGATGTGATPTHKFGTPGTYTVSVVMTDAVGNTVSKSLTETVSKAPASGIIPGLSPTESWGVLGAVIAVIVVVAALALLLRRRKPKASPSPPAASPPAETPASGGPGTGPTTGAPPPGAA